MILPVDEIYGVYEAIAKFGSASTLNLVTISYIPRFLLFSSIYFYPCKISASI